MNQIYNSEMSLTNFIIRNVKKSLFLKIGSSEHEII